MNTQEHYKVPILSFYSGGGFLDMGFEKAGFEVVWTNENDPIFAQLHAAGITSWRKARGNGIKAEIFNTKSIAEIAMADIISEAFPSGKPVQFGMIGGPPCQDFSSNGNNGGFSGERGKLTILYLDKIKELKPLFFVMENVTGLIKIKSNRERLAKLLAGIESDYYIDHSILNALDFGVPQFRERVFFIGVKKEAIKKEKVSLDFLNKWFIWPRNMKYDGAMLKFKWPTAVAFGKRLSKPKDIPLELCVESCLIPQNQINKIKNANEGFNLYVKNSFLSKILEGETNRPSFKRLHRYKYSPTACYGNNEVHLHPYKHRRLTVRETLRIQGVPDEYELPQDLPLTQKFKMIGNGVPVPLAEAVALSIKDFLDKYLV